MNTMKIGWIGLGLMGNVMSRQLLKAGYLVTVYNRDKEKETDLKKLGANTATTPKELLERTDVVIIMVTDDKAVRDIFEKADGLLAADVSNKIIINMSTVSPAVNKEMGEKCAKIGSHFLDAPVSGSVRQAESAQLVIMAGGDPTIFKTVKPVLDAMGKLTVHVGEAGNGNVSKLAINTLLGFYTQGLAEAIILANKNGIDTALFLDILGNTPLANPVSKLKGEAILNSEFGAAFSLNNLLKDLRLASELGLTTPLGKTALETFSAASKLFGSEDLIAVYKYLSESDHS